MRFCSRCSAAVPDDAGFCPCCGSRLTPEDYAEYHPRRERREEWQDGSSRPLSVLQYIGLFALNAIPVVGLIFMIVWALGVGNNPHLKNFARAALVVRIIGALLAFLSVGWVFRLMDRVLERIPFEEFPYYEFHYGMEAPQANGVSSFVCTEKALFWDGEDFCFEEIPCCVGAERAS